MGLRGSGGASTGQMENVAKRAETISRMGGVPLSRTIAEPQPGKDGEIPTFLRLIDQRIDEIIAAHERLEGRLSMLLTPGPETGDEPEPPCASNLGSNLQGFLRRLTRIYHHTNNLSDRIAL